MECVCQSVEKDQYHFQRFVPGVAQLYEDFKGGHFKQRILLPGILYLWCKITPFNHEIQYSHSLISSSNPSVLDKHSVQSHKLCVIKRENMIPDPSTLRHKGHSKLS